MIFCIQKDLHCPFLKCKWAEETGNVFFFSLRSCVINLFPSSSLTTKTKRDVLPQEMEAERWSVVTWTSKSRKDFHETFSTHCVKWWNSKAQQTKSTLIFTQLHILHSRKNRTLRFLIICWCSKRTIHIFENNIHSTTRTSPVCSKDTDLTAPAEACSA